MAELLENLSGLVIFGSVTVFYIVSLIFVIALFASEVNENGWVALVSFVIFIGLVTWQNDVGPFLPYFGWGLLLYYLLIGVSFSD